MYIGVDYYPEHWPEERWVKDIEMMSKAGFNVVRLAEFAWAKMEPVEGTYNFEWLDRAIELFAHAGIDVILGTPTGSMPRWVSLQYPDSVATDITGHPLPYGARKDNCPTNLTYRNLGLNITQAMAEHYKDNYTVIGWQIDNELSWPQCYCQGCSVEWYKWLQDKFSTIENLNEQWGTIFWSHTYQSFDSIPFPRGKGYGYSNPSLELDYRRFHSRNVVNFQNEQIQVIRKITPEKFITHNAMGFFSMEIDYYELARELDFISWDYYNNTPNPWNENSWIYGSAANDMMRSLKQKNFWITETSAGPVGGKEFGSNLRPGHMKKFAYQCVGHGADGYIWFRFRTCRYGYEQLWHGLLGHDGNENRRFRESAQVTSELMSIADELKETSVLSKVAIVFSYEDEWAFRIQPNSTEFSYLSEIYTFYKPFLLNGLNVDFVKPGTDLQQYKIVVVPSNYILLQETADSYKKFAESGGTLLITFRSGVKNEHNIPYESILPGKIRELAGVRIEEYESIPKGTEYKVLSKDQVFSAVTFADWIIPENAKSLLTYDEYGITDYSAVTVNEYMSGKVYYIGTVFKDEGFYSSLITQIIVDSHLCATIHPPKDVEIITRSNESKNIVFIINHSLEQKVITLPEGVNLLTGDSVCGKTQLAPDEVFVMKYMND